MSFEEQEKQLKILFEALVPIHAKLSTDDEIVGEVKFASDTKGAKDYKISSTEKKGLSPIEFTPEVIKNFRNDLNAFTTLCKNPKALDALRQVFIKRAEWNSQSGSAAPATPATGVK